jgi:site-specific recombinase XerC
MTTAFRSFFRFLFQNGELQSDLAASVPAVADWRLSNVPKYLNPDEVERVVGSCGRQTSTGRRDYAIFSCSLASASVPGKSLLSNLMTLTGGPARSSFAVRFVARPDALACGCR